jgi:hypothetical protein
MQKGELALEAEQKKLVIGFPDFWRVVEKTYPKFFEIGLRAGQALNSITDREYAMTDLRERTILNLSILAGITMTEVITLATNGLGQGAMKCLRTLMETSINTEYLRLRPAEFQYYKEWYWVERYKELTYLRKYRPAIIPELGTQVIKDVEQNMARVRPLFCRFKNKNELRDSWCLLNLADRSAVTGHEEIYRMINSIASSFIHGTIYGLDRHFDKDNDLDRIAVPPTLEWSAQALSAAHHCLVRVIMTISETFNVQPDPSLEQLTEDLIYAWSSEDKENAAGQTSPNHP